MGEIFFPQPPSQPLVLVVDLEALAHNYRTLVKSLGAGKTCGAVLKANAYGMGLKEAASRLYREGCQHFFMAHLSEALDLKPYVGKESHIYVLSGLREGEESAYAQARIVPVLGDLSQIQAWNQFAKKKNKTLKAALDFDTGMTRTGLSWEDIKKLSFHDLSNVELILVMSHLACAYEATHPMNEKQRQIFEKFRQRFHTIPASFSASGGMNLGEPYHYDLVRPGLALTGCRLADNPLLKPVMKAYAQVLKIHTVPPGTSVGYDAHFVVHRPSRIATISVGYADGYFRSLSNQGSVYCRGKLLPIVGYVSMDLTTIDVTDGDVNVGDWVELFGDNLPAKTVADAAHTISWELFTRLGPRFERLYLCPSLATISHKPQKTEEDINKVEIKSESTENSSFARNVG